MLNSTFSHFIPLRNELLPLQDVKYIKNEVCFQKVVIMSCDSIQHNTHSNYEYKEEDIIESHLSFLYNTVGIAVDESSIYSSTDMTTEMFLPSTVTEDKVFRNENYNGDQNDSDCFAKDFCETNTLEEYGKASLLGKRVGRHSRLLKKLGLLKRLEQFSRRFGFGLKRRCKPKNEPLMPTLNFVVYPTHKERLDLMEDPSCHESVASLITTECEYEPLVRKGTVYS